MRFIDLFGAMLDYHTRTRHLPECKLLGDKVEKMLKEWDETHPADVTTDPAGNPVRTRGKRA